jgi:hypothetical protein
MEQGTFLNPNLNALQRAVVQALFKQTGGQYDDFGSLDSVGMAYGAKQDTNMFALTSGSLIETSENVSVAPKLTLKGRQFTDQNEAYLQMGTLASDDVQASASGATLTVTAALGKTFDLAKRNIAFTSATVAAVAKTRDVDFYVEEQGGLQRFPFIAAGIAAGASVVNTFDVPALTRKYIANAGTILNYYGSLLLLEYDQKNTQKVRCEWNFPTVILSPTNMGNFDPAKIKVWEMDVQVAGSWTKKFRVS